MALMLVVGQAASVYGENSHSKNNVFGVARLRLTPVFDGHAASLFADLGPKNYRANLTWGTIMCEHSFKVGAEYLAQKYNLNRHHDNDDECGHDKNRKWVQQWAVGADYQYSLECGECGEYVKAVRLSGEYSQGTRKNIREHHYLAGSDFYVVEGGAVLQPWECSNLYVGVNYDAIRYEHGHHSDHHNKWKGQCGGTIEFKQTYCHDYALEINAQFRKPYNYLEGVLSWNTDTCYGNVDAGLIVGYTWGKDKIPNSTLVGVELGLSFGPIDFCHDNCCNYAPGCESQELIDWVTHTAVYIPQVLVGGHRRHHEYQQTPNVSTPDVKVAEGNVDEVIETVVGTKEVKVSEEAVIS